MTAGRFVRRLLVVALVAAFVVVCLRLGWWQWQRFGLTGSAQNLGYTLQWPVFALFAVIMWWRLSKLEAKHRHAREPGDAGRPEAHHPPTMDTPHTSTEPATHPHETRHTPTQTHHTPTQTRHTPTQTRHTPTQVRHTPGGGVGDEEDELAAYNRYLARLHAEDLERGH